MQELLDGLLPRPFPGLLFQCVPHDGKTDLERSIPHNPWAPGGSARCRLDCRLATASVQECAAASLGALGARQSMVFSEHSKIVAVGREAEADCT